MNKVRLAVFLMMAMVLTAGLVKADPYRFPWRKFGQGTARMEPLWDFWRSGKMTPRWQALVGTNARPMMAWKFIRGRVIAQRPYTFLLDAEVFTMPGESKHARVVLWRAPVGEKSEWERAHQDREGLFVAHDGATARANYAAAQAESHSISGNAWQEAGWIVPEANAYAQANANAEYAAAQRARRRENQARNQQADLTRRIGEDNGVIEQYSGSYGEYVVEVFALEIGKSREGWPVFDTGIVYPW